LAYYPSAFSCEYLIMPARKRPASPLLASRSPPGMSIDKETPVSASDHASASVGYSAIAAVSASPDGDHSSSTGPGHGDSLVSVPVVSGGSSALSVLCASPARDRTSSPGRGGSPASPAVSSPGKNKQLFMLSVTPQTMSCNLSKLLVGLDTISRFSPNPQVLLCQVSV
jgi:hypothetical protein